MYKARVILDETRMKHIVVDRQLEAFQESVHRARARTKPKVDAILAPSVGKVKYPIDWTTIRQQRAFFATRGFGKGIPYQRTGALNAGWNSISHTISGLGTSITIWNERNYAQFVVGTFASIAPMQRFHRNTGWQPVILTRDTIRAVLIEGILKEFRWIVVN